MKHNIKRVSMSLLLALALPLQANAAPICTRTQSTGTEYASNGVCDTRRDKDSTTKRQKQEEIVSETETAGGCVINEYGVCVSHIDCETNRAFIAANGLTSGSCANKKPCTGDSCETDSGSTACPGSGCDATGSPDAEPVKTPEPAKPTSAPTLKPTTAPTVKPTTAPTAKPTKAPTSKPTAAPTAKPTSKPTVSEASSLESEAISLMNEDRVKNGMQALPMDAELARIARIKAEDMRDNGYFAHESPTYGKMSVMLKTMGYAFTAAGENIAHHASVLKAEAAFMSSAGHKRNILSASWTKVGIGIAVDKNGYIYECQVFAR